MEECKSKTIKSQIHKHKLSYIWLINQLRMRGITTDKTEMSSVIAGNRKGAKAEKIIRCSLKILSDYEKGKVLVENNIK